MKLIRALITTLKKHPYRSLILLLVVLWISGVRVYNMLHLEKGYTRISGLLESVDDLKSATTSSELLEAKYFAAMSAQVYRLQDGKIEATDPAACNLDGVLSDWKLFPIDNSFPDKPDGDQRQKARWDGELVYGVWYRKLPTGQSQIALVFRGTHTTGDWWSNARWVTKHLRQGWDQYDLTRSVASYVSTKLVKKHPDLFGSGKPQIVAAGHSLGGGLAQQAGYAANAIDRVYSFNGSSVTGFYSVDEAERVKNKKGMRVYRISERGEVLALLRSFMKIIYPVVERNPKIIQATYNFGTMGLVKQHSMDDLACALMENE